MRQNEHENRAQEAHAEDEVDLFELLKTLWRWKWFVLAVTVAGFAGSLLYTAGAEEEYKASSTLQIGKVFGVPVESAGDIEAYLRSSEFTASLPQAGGFEYRIRTDEYESETILATIQLQLTGRAAEAETAKQVVKTAAESLLSRHRALYEEALEEYKASGEKLASLPGGKEGLALLLLDSYTYTTRALEEPSVRRVASNRTRFITVATVSALLLGVLLAFFIDALRTRIREERGVE